MNAGNRRVGKAIGFRIKYLTQASIGWKTNGFINFQFGVVNYLFTLAYQQLKDLKTTDNKSSLLHFVAATVERKFPQVLEFSEDLCHVPIAARGKQQQQQQQQQKLKFFLLFITVQLCC